MIWVSDICVSQLKPKVKIGGLISKLEGDWALIGQREEVLEVLPQPPLASAKTVEPNQ